MEQTVSLEKPAPQEKPMALDHLGRKDLSAIKDHLARRVVLDQAANLEKLVLRVPLGPKDREDFQDPLDWLGNLVSLELNVSQVRPVRRDRPGSLEHLDVLAFKVPLVSQARMAMTPCTARAHHVNESLKHKLQYAGHFNTLFSWLIMDF